MILKYVAFELLMVFDNLFGICNVRIVICNVWMLISMYGC